LWDFSDIMKTAKERATFLRCQYCGKNLWPLRGLFDEDFCSRDHRQRYHERVRKALEHLPKTETRRPTGIAGFQFEKPRVQQPAATRHVSTDPWQNPAAPAVPDFAHASMQPSFAGARSRFAPMNLAPVKSVARAAAGTATAIAPNVLSIDTLRQRFHQKSTAAVTMALEPAGITLRPGNVKASQHARLAPAAFDELNHVYVHVPDPLLEAVLPVCGSLAAQLQPVAVTSKAQHTAVAGPSGAGRIEFFPMHSRSGAFLPMSADAEHSLPQTADRAHEHIWLEDPMTWQIPVNLAPERSTIAMLPAMDRALALEQFRGAQPASAANPAPLAWEFHANGLEHGRISESMGPAIAPAAVIDSPAPRDGASAPLSDENAVFDASTFALLVPEIDVETADLEMLASALADTTVRAEFVEPGIQDSVSAPVSDEVAVFDAATFSLALPEICVEARSEMLADALLDVAPEIADGFGAQTGIGEKLFPRATGWFPMETESVLPANSPEIHAALAEPRLGAGLEAMATPMLVRSGANSLQGQTALNLPYQAVRLKHGPEFFAAEPVVADSVARPISAKAQALVVAMALPEIEVSTCDLLSDAAGTEMVISAGTIGQATLIHNANALDTASLEAPEIDLAPAGFHSNELKKLSLWARNPEDQSPRHFGCMEPRLELCLPQSHYEEYPLALQVSLPEPRTVTVFETASYNQQPPSNVLSISEVRAAKRFTVPSYMKGMAAGLMLASFLWFGSSSIKSDGITMRPGDLIRLTIQRRAVYEVSDNFHAGLASWEGKGFAKTWAYDQEGFIRPGRLALYKPSHDMSDYKMEFLAQIERKSVDWVFRAEDEQNYYAMKLAVTEPGPRPLVALVRYAVVDGKRESHGEQPLQVMMHNNRPYRVSVDVKGNRFLTSIEGQVVDSWSDDRLKSGGVGLFSEGSEKARVYWLKVTKNSDFLGKLCSILVPKES
jgi:hypothetical protein